jgi:hypothetical protein
MAVNITIQEVGGNVVWTATGTLNVAGLTKSSTQVGGIGFDANNAIFGSGLGASADVYSGSITKPASFGTGGAAATSGSGDYLSIQNIPATLWVPAGYTSGAAISNTTTYTGSFTTLGLTPGTYTYSWGAGGNADTLTLLIGVTPSPTPTSTQTTTPTPTPTSTLPIAPSTVEITSNNYSGQTANITFFPCSGGTISLGEHVLPYSYESTYYYGQYSLYFSAYNSTCTYDIVCPSPTPTNTQTPTITPTNTPTSTPGTSGDFNVTVSQVGPDVVWSGSGSFNLGALTLGSTQTIGSGFQATQAIWAIGPITTVEEYDGASFTTYPTSFGTTGSPPSPTSSGSTFGILNDISGGRLLIVPSGYTSNSEISGIATYPNTTIAGMGLTPGTYTWAWGSGGNASSLVMTIN